MKPYFPELHKATQHSSQYPKSEDVDPFFSIARFRSFCYAWSGILHFFRKEQNAKIHFVAAVTVIILSFWFQINNMEIIAIMFSIAFVWIAEMFNTAFEKAMDLVTLQRHPQVKIVKDVAAGAVLVASIASATTGLIIFIPKIF